MIYIFNKLFIFIIIDFYKNIYQYGGKGPLLNP